MIDTMKRTTLFKTGRSVAVRIPKDWVRGVSDVVLEQREDGIFIHPQTRTLGDVAKECHRIGGSFPARKKQTETGIRWAE